MARQRLARRQIRGAGAAALTAVHGHRADPADSRDWLDDGDLLDRPRRAAAATALSRPRAAGLSDGEGGSASHGRISLTGSSATSFDGLASSLADAVIVTSGQVPRRFQALSVTSNFFQVIGVSALRGRLFDQSDARPGAAATAVISHAFWMQEFGGDPAAIGKTISLRTPFTVIGVLAPGFRYMTAADVILLLEPQVAANPLDHCRRRWPGARSSRSGRGSTRAVSSLRRAR